MYSGKSILVVALIILSFCSLWAEEVRLTAELAITFGPAASTLKSEPITVIGYGFSDSRNANLARTRAINNANIQLARQISGSRFTYGVSNGETVLEIETDAVITGAQVEDLFTLTSPNAPEGVLPYMAPCDCAASSINGILRWSQYSLNLV